MRRIALVGLLLGTTAAPCSSPVLAGEDEGVRSVFARGAGNRALAMGGAYVAVGGEASTVLWNPAGLGLVERRQFQAAHTNLIGLGFQEQYASIVLPSWRWGAASLTYRHFGVDGIDERDDRNTILGEDLSDGETEIAFAYGRQLPGAWSVGAVIKMQRQSLAGRSDSGLGLDLGVRVQPLVATGSRSLQAERLSMGLAIRNLVEPSIRLDEEPVPDPTGFRLGVAYDTPIWHEGALLGTLDFEKTQDMDLDLHAGLELRINPYLAMRAGLNDGMLTAGTGVSWRDIAVDYAFEDNIIDSVHRFGISLAFGPTTEQSRQLVRAAEEAELQQKLQNAFAQRNKERLAGLMQQAHDAMSAEDYDTALEVLAMVRVLQPSQPQVTDLEVAAYRGRGLKLEQAGDYGAATVELGRALSLDPQDQESRLAMGRVRAESDREAARTVEIRRLLDLAMDAYAADDLVAAAQGFTHVLEVHPEDQEAEAMLRRVQSTLQSRAETLVRQARLLIQTDQFAEAEAMLTQARGLNGETAGWQSASSLLDRNRRTARQARSRAEAPGAKTSAMAQASPSPSDEPPARPAQVTRAPLSEERRRELSEIYRRGMVAVAEQRPDEAIRFWEIVWEADPTFQGVEASLKGEYLTRGMEHFAAGKLNEAVIHWERVLSIDPKDEKAKGYLERARQQQYRIRELSTGH